MVYLSLQTSWHISAAGAFFAGVLVAESKSQATARVLTSPLKDMLGALFFVSVGALMDVSQLPFFIVPVRIFVATSFAAKFITVYLSSKSQGLSKKASIQTAFGSSASGGELALVVAKGGADVGATSPFVLPMIGTMTIITSFLSPYLVKFGWKVGDRFRDESQEKRRRGRRRRNRARKISSRALRVFANVLKVS